MCLANVHRGEERGEQLAGTSWLSEPCKEETSQTEEKAQHESKDALEVRDFENKQITHTHTPKKKLETLV